jgi:hypothetical protein
VRTLHPVLLPDPADLAADAAWPPVRFDAGAGSFQCAEAGTTVSLDALRALVGDGDTARDFGAACTALTEGDAASAARGFLAQAETSDAPAAALYGLAASLSATRQDDGALEIAEFLAACPDAPSRAQLLCGFAAYCLGRKEEARRNLARAARMARGRPEARDELRFAQTILLKQQFVS